MESLLQYSCSDGDDSDGISETNTNSFRTKELAEEPMGRRTVTGPSHHQSSPAKLTNDYLGLNSSSEDETDVPATRTESRWFKSGGHCTYFQSVDTLLNAYQLSEREVGVHGRESQAIRLLPQNQPTRPSKRRRPDPTVQPKTFSQCLYEPNPDSCSVKLQEDLVTGSPLDSRLFQTHPIVAPYLVGTRESQLPANSGWHILRSHRACVNTLDWGRSTWSHLLLSASMDGTMRVWNGIGVTDGSGSKSGSCRWTVSPHNRVAVRCARWSPDGRSAVSGGYDKNACMTDVERGCQSMSWLHTHFVSCLLFHPCSEHLVITGTLGQINCWDVRERTSKAVKTFRADFNEVQDIAFLNDGNEFLCCTNSIDRDAADKTVMAWDFRSGAILSNQIFQERFHCTKLRVHPSKKWFVSQTNGNYVALFSTSRPFKMNKKKRYEGHKVDGYWVGCDLSSDGRFVYSGSSDGKLYGYSFQHGSLIKRWTLSDRPCLAVECHPLLPSTVAVSGYDGNIYICQ